MSTLVDGMDNFIVIFILKKYRCLLKFAFYTSNFQNCTQNLKKKTSKCLVFVYQCNILQTSVSRIHYSANSTTRAFEMRFP